MEKGTFQTFKNLINDIKDIISFIEKSLSNIKTPSLKVAIGQTSMIICEKEQRVGSKHSVRQTYQNTLKYISNRVQRKLHS